MERHEAERASAVKDSIWVTGCRSWYLDDRGIPATWPWTFDRFREVMAEPDFDCYELRESGTVRAADAADDAWRA
jgi:hypothetical protein